jgi:hypothetical protein
MMIIQNSSRWCKLLALSLMLISCNEKRSDDIQSELNIEGTWKLISETKIEKGDTIFNPAAEDQPMIKIINKSHFAFLRHDLKQGKDSTAMFVAGGGTYRLDGSKYTENLDYCNSREWENHTFEFTVQIENDTLVQTGREKIEGAGVDRIIIEKYISEGVR